MVCKGKFNPLSKEAKQIGIIFDYEESGNINDALCILQYQQMKRSY